MKAGDVFTAHTPESPHIDGHKYKLVREITGRFVAQHGWLTVDVETGDERTWLDEHFGKVLRSK